MDRFYASQIICLEMDSRLLLEKRIIFLNRLHIYNTLLWQKYTHTYADNSKARYETHSWYQAPSEVQGHTAVAGAVLSMWVTLSEERTGPLFNAVGFSSTYYV
jgi:hypothetical protein